MNQNVHVSIKISPKPKNIFKTIKFLRHKNNQTSSNLIKQTIIRNRPLCGINGFEMQYEFREFFGLFVCFFLVKSLKLHEIMLFG